MKAEACRRLADMSDDGLRKTIWLERADDWEGLAKKAERAQRSLSLGEMAMYWSRPIGHDRIARTRCPHRLAPMQSSLDGNGFTFW